MVWFKVDDNLAFHAKTVAAGNAAMGLWVRAGSWCAHQLTDGFIPKDVALTMGKPSEIKRLLAVNLWVDGPDGYTFWQWNEPGRQPLREQVEAERDAARERKDRWKERKRNGDGTPFQDRSERVAERSKERVRNDAHARAATRPDPTRPDQSTCVDAAVAATPEDPTSALLAEHANAYAQPPPPSALIPVKREIMRLVAERVEPERIRDGLARLRERRLAASLLPQLVTETTPTRKASTTDQRVADGLALAARYEAEESA
jgi:hypothetical protein